MAKKTQKKEPLSVVEMTNFLTDTTKDKKAITEFGRLDRKPGLWPIEDRIKTGSVSFDLALGVGGWPRGRIVEISGHESSGKSTLCLTTVANAQAQGIPTIYFDLENALSGSYAEALGVDLDLMPVSKPMTSNGVLSLETVLTNTRSILMKARENPEIEGPVIVFDSIPAMTPQSTIDAEPGARLFADRARILAQELPNLGALAHETNALLLFINQMRQKIGAQPFEEQEDTTGGKALKFSYSLRVRTSGRPAGANKRSDEGSPGHDMSIRAIKNKVASPFSNASCYLHTVNDGRVGFDLSSDIFLSGLRVGIVDPGTSVSVNKKGGFEVVSKANAFAIGLTEEEIETAAAEYEEDMEYYESLSAAEKREYGKPPVFNPDVPYLHSDMHGGSASKDAFMNMLDHFPETLALIGERILESLNHLDEDDADVVEDDDDYKYDPETGEIIEDSEETEADEESEPEEDDTELEDGEEDSEDDSEDDDQEEDEEEAESDDDEADEEEEDSEEED